MAINLRMRTTISPRQWQPWTQLFQNRYPFAISAHLMWANLVSYSPEQGLGYS